MRDICPGYLLLEQRNHIAAGDKLEIILPDGTARCLPAEHIYDENGRKLLYEI